MVKKSFNLLFMYIAGIVVSMFLTIPLSPLVGFSPKLFSVITGITAISFMYSKMWKYGKYDELKKIVSTLTPLKLMIPVLIITVIVEIFVLVYKSNGNLDISMLAGTFWFFPFTGFFNKTNFVPVTLIITVLIAGILYFAYYMGIKGLSFTDKILTARRIRIENKAQKHFDEIEKIKDQYRKK